MLLELSIHDLAIIDDLSISVGPGLNVFTGETGAGKSIIIDAVDLVLGDRASAELIRTGAEEARVEARFDLTREESIKPFLEEAGIEASDELVVKRVIHRTGRNRVYINDSLSTLMALSELGRRLIDVCGQSEHQSLTRPDEHIEVFDRFGGLEKLRHEMAGSYWMWASIKKELDGLRAQLKGAGEDRELLEFQSKEIAELSPLEGEDDTLKKEFDTLKNAEKLIGISIEAEKTLYSDSGSVSERVGAVTKIFEDAARFDETFKKAGERLKSVLLEVEDCAGVVRDYGASIEADPARLEAVEARLDALIKLKRKYGPLIKDILAKKSEIDAQLGGVVDYNERIEALEARLLHATDEAALVSGALTEARREKAGALSEGMERELKELGMEGAIFEAIIETEAEGDTGPRFGEKGADRVSFFISANPGEETKPLAKIASGGELSRIMLAIKGLTVAGRVPTLIFDEVDTGVGGGMAEVVAKKLRKVSATHQVFSVTHLPQIAAFADTHYNVTKEQTGEGRTVTRVKKLTPPERVEQIARMLGGSTVTETTVKHAKEMLANAESS